MLALRTLQRSSRLLATRAASTTPVALVGCGMPVSSPCGNQLVIIHAVDASAATAGRGGNCTAERPPSPVDHAGPRHGLVPRQADLGRRRALGHVDRHRRALVPGRRQGRPGGAEFAAFKKEHEGKVRFHASIADMPKPDGNMMAMARTRRLLRAATASTRVASTRGGRGWFLFRF